jgi:hypothetical protein
MDSSSLFRASKRLKSCAKTSATRLLPADANAGAIDIDLATADALPAFINFRHIHDPTFYKIYLT